MDKVRMYMYNTASEGGNALKDELQVLGIRKEGSTFRGGADFTVINWGAGEVPRSVLRSRILNKPDAVCKAINKLDTFKFLLGKARAVPNTTDIDVAKGWARDGKTVYARTRVEGREGQGIKVVRSNDGNNNNAQRQLQNQDEPVRGLRAEGQANRQNFPRLQAQVAPYLVDDMSAAEMPQARLYTLRIAPKAIGRGGEGEYRVHVVGGKVVAVHRKVRKAGTDGSNLIKNSDNGWEFKRVTEYAADVETQAVKAIKAIGLDFGAVDIIVNNDDLAHVLEVNTAPGIDGMEWTVRQYATAIKELIANNA